MRRIYINTEQLDHCIEECSEVIQALVKIKRFGADNYHPLTKISNRAHLHDEWDQLYRLMDLLLYPKQQ